ncbi:chascon [Anaeramoeba flamelloides]|uniref:Chascon n=1 Tax=Anaeramoeba flamelloides TaxID=1746091 RepID=A0ABQ8X7M4_9EUKA|nr:chascon [Anaeramoeba flamelloides]
MVTTTFKSLLPNLTNEPQFSTLKQPRSIAISFFEDYLRSSNTKRAEFLKPTKEVFEEFFSILAKENKDKKKEIPFFKKDKINLGCTIKNLLISFPEENYNQKTIGNICYHKIRNENNGSDQKNQFQNKTRNSLIIFISVDRLSKMIKDLFNKNNNSNKNPDSQFKQSQIVFNDQTIDLSFLLFGENKNTIIDKLEKDLFNFLIKSKIYTKINFIHADTIDWFSSNLPFNSLTTFLCFQNEISFNIDPKFSKKEKEKENENENENEKEKEKEKNKTEETAEEKENNLIEGIKKRKGEEEKKEKEKEKEKEKRNDKENGSGSKSKFELKTENIEKLMLQIPLIKEGQYSINNGSTIINSIILKKIGNFSFQNSQNDNNVGLGTKKLNDNNNHNNNHVHTHNSNSEKNQDNKENGNQVTNKFQFISIISSNHLHNFLKSLNHFNCFLCKTEDHNETFLEILFMKSSAAIGKSNNSFSILQSCGRNCFLIYIEKENSKQEINQYTGNILLETKNCKTTYHNIKDNHSYNNNNNNKFLNNNNNNKNNNNNNNNNNNLHTPSQAINDNFLDKFANSKNKIMNTFQKNEKITNDSNIKFDQLHCKILENIEKIIFKKEKSISNFKLKKEIKKKTINNLNELLTNLICNLNQFNCEKFWRILFKENNNNSSKFVLKYLKNKIKMHTNSNLIYLYNNNNNKQNFNKQQNNSNENYIKIHFLLYFFNLIFLNYNKNEGKEIIDEEKIIINNLINFIFQNKILIKNSKKKLSNYFNFLIQIFDFENLISKLLKELISKIKLKIENKLELFCKMNTRNDYNSIFEVHSFSYYLPDLRNDDSTNNNIIKKLIQNSLDKKEKAIFKEVNFEIFESSSSSYSSFSSNDDNDEEDDSEEEEEEDDEEYFEKEKKNGNKNIENNDDEEEGEDKNGNNSNDIAEIENKNNGDDFGNINKNKVITDSKNSNSIDHDENNTLNKNYDNDQEYIFDLSIDNILNTIFLTDEQFSKIIPNPKKNIQLRQKERIKNKNISQSINFNAISNENSESQKEKHYQLRNEKPNKTETLELKQKKVTHNNHDYNTRDRIDANHSNLHIRINQNNPNNYNKHQNHNKMNDDNNNKKYKEKQKEKEKEKETENDEENEYENENEMEMEIEMEIETEKEEEKEKQRKKNKKKQKENDKQKDTKKQKEKENQNRFQDPNKLSIWLTGLQPNTTKDKKKRRIKFPPNNNLQNNHKNQTQRPILANRKRTLNEIPNINSDQSPSHNDTQNQDKNNKIIAKSKNSFHEILIMERSGKTGNGRRILIQKKKKKRKIFKKKINGKSTLNRPPPKKKSN